MRGPEIVVKGSEGVKIFREPGRVAGSARRGRGRRRLFLLM